MAVNQILKEIRKARKQNNFEVDPTTALMEVIEELIDCRKALDEIVTRLTALEARQ